MISSIHEASQLIKSGESTPLDILNECLARIDQFEDRVKAWVLVDREGARRQAQKLTDELARGEYRGPLHGIPIGIKDIFDVFDLPTAAGSNLWKNSIARQDCTVVRRLREAGAVILGKTVTTQYASFDPPKTRNPWNTARTPGGSSSGSAAAVACGMCLGSIGSQTGGSITRPASYCGVAGCKPSYGLVPLDGILPLAHSMDHPGPMANKVADLALLMQVISGENSTIPAEAVPDYMAILENTLSEAPVIGVVRGLFEDLADESMHLLMEATLCRIEEEGAILLEIALPTGFAEVLARHRTVMAVEAAMYHEPRLIAHPEDYQPNIRKLLEEGLACPAPEYARCKAHQHQLTEDMLGIFENVDALLLPATRGPAPDAATTGDPAFNSPWSYTGLPSISIPAGWSSDDMPMAVQLVGGRYSEGDLFPIAAWCEEVIGFERRWPAPS